MGRPCFGPYSVSKHGVVGLTRTAAKEVGEGGFGSMQLLRKFMAMLQTLVYQTLVFPVTMLNAYFSGPVQTPMLSRILADASHEDRRFTSTYNNLPLKPLGTGEEVAKTFAFLLSDDSTWTTGVIYPVDGDAFC
jgi:NAD(P)-dependent dehydrogenase (short-subunit alcohol dehydrogenase family)